MLEGINQPLAVWVRNIFPMVRLFHNCPSLGLLHLRLKNLILATMGTVFWTMWPMVLICYGNFYDAILLLQMKKPR